MFTVFKKIIKIGTFSLFRGRIWWPFRTSWDTVDGSRGRPSYQDTPGQVRRLYDIQYICRYFLKIYFYLYGTRGQSNSPNNSDKMKLKLLQCCQLGGLKYLYSEILTLDVHNKKSKKVYSFLQIWQNFSWQFLSCTKFYRPATPKMSALWKHWVVISFRFVRKIWSAGTIRLTPVHGH
jgi:hypothetical protein